MAGESEHNGILLAVVMNCGCSVGFGDHSRGTDIVAGVDDGVLADHAFGLATAGLDGGGGSVNDGFLFVRHLGRWEY